MLVVRKRKANLESRGDFLRARHGDKQGVEVRAVAALNAACVKCVTVSPAGAALVVAHVCQDVLVNSTTLFIIAAFHLSDLLDGKLGRQTSNRYKLVGREQTSLLGRAQTAESAGRTLTSDHVVGNLEAVFLFVGLGGFGEQHLIAVFVFMSLPQREIAFLRKHPHVLEWAGLGHWNPYAQRCTRMRIPYCKGIVKDEVTFRRPGLCLRERSEQQHEGKTA